MARNTSTFFGEGVQNRHLCWFKTTEDTGFL